jgi:hypothetical protein
MGQWPARADAALRTHVEDCDVCGDLAAAAAAIVELRDAPDQPVSVPDASVVWYRAQIHARIDAATRAARPLRMAQAAGAVCFIAVALAWWNAGSPWIVALWNRFTGFAFSFPRVNLVPDLASGGATWLTVAASVAIVWMFLISVAWYVADWADE